MWLCLFSPAELSVKALHGISVYGFHLTEVECNSTAWNLRLWLCMATSSAQLKLSAKALHDISVCGLPTETECESNAWNLRLWLSVIVFMSLASHS